jgi:hypothetical protein
MLELVKIGRADEDLIHAVPLDIHTVHQDRVNLGCGVV